MRKNVTHIILTDLSANKPLHWNLKTSRCTCVDVLLSTLYWIVFHGRLNRYIIFPSLSSQLSIEAQVSTQGIGTTSISSRPAMNHNSPSWTSISLSAASSSLLSVWAVGEEVSYSLWSNFYIYDCKNYFAWVDFLTMTSWVLAPIILLCQIHSLQRFSLAVLAKASITITITHT